MKNFFNRIAVKICFSILLIETMLLLLMGIFYVRSFGIEIDQRVQEKLALPGILMSQRALNYNSVNDVQVISELIQEHVLEAFITKKSGEIFFAGDELKLGKSIEQLLAPEEQFSLMEDSEKNQQITFETDSGRHFRSSLSHIIFNDRIIGYLYIKIDATQVEEEKRNILLLFLFGSLLTIFLTTLIEAFYLHRLFIPRIRAISTVLNKAKTGDLSSRITLFGSEDELNSMIHLINSMLKTVSEMIKKLTYIQEALTASEERFRELSDLLPEGVFELDTQGNFTYVNLQLCNESLYSREEFYAKLHFTDLVAEEDHLRSTENFQKRMVGRFAELSEYTVRRKDGTMLPVMINASFIGHPGQPKGLRGIVVNLTERNRLQKQLWQAQKMESIGRLSASVAHEFGNPLVGINFLLMDMHNLPGLDESQKKTIELGLDECRKLKKSITDFQAFAKPSSDEKGCYDINKIIDDILLIYNKYITDNNVDIVVNLEQNLPDISIVKDQIHQVLVNILMNALDALQGGKRQIYISTKARENEVLAIIEDTGCGIPEESLNQIFEPFFSTKPEVEGTGLGLYVSYHLIKNHNGEIQVESEQGAGSIFTISLPVDEINSEK